MSEISDTLVTHLDDTPVLGVSMANVSLLRLDRQNTPAPGNKWYKLQGSLGEAQRRGVHRLVSFGGAWSNHLHALAAVGREYGYATVGIVRGDMSESDSAMLADASAWGMELLNVSRTEYRRRNDPEYLAQVARRFAPCLVIPEGGSGALGVEGCMDIARQIKGLALQARHIILPVGTGTTLAGLVGGLGGDYEVLGVAALKGAADLDQNVRQALADCNVQQPARWRILHEEHCGGFARVTAELREFMLAFEDIHQVPLEPVYTGKMLLAIYHRLRSGEWDSATRLLAVHTGGLQGRRGFTW